MSNYVVGIHSVQALLEHHASTVTAIFFFQSSLNERLATLRTRAQDQHIPVHYVSAEELDQRAHQQKHQGVIAYIQTTQQKMPDLMDWLGQVKGPIFLLILDTIQDPHNLGACLRTADAAGVHAVIAPKDKSVGLTPVVRKVACGADQTVPFFQVTNLARTLEQLKDAGIWLYGATAEALPSLYEQEFTGHIGLVMGNEGSGMRRLTQETCDMLFHIPMKGRVESLNVSVATAVCLYEVVRQRISPKMILPK